ncbi:MAG: class I SAM-dependent methyltransferase [Pseudomonadales bacterium]|nr:class I SAM-dependent methyltransferase [Pseudomonadales bacterium]
MKWILALTMALALPLTAAADEDFEPTAAKITAALGDARRTDSDTARDENRKPLETLEFFGLRDNMTVLELVPGGGWYTKILAPVLEEKGKLYISIGAERTFGKFKDQAGFGSMQLIPFATENFIRTPGARRASVPEFSFGLRNKIDLALTFRNMHNFTEEGRHNINKAVFEALKPGGYYGVVDHTRRHMQEDYDEVWRRMDPVEIIKEVEAAGFKFVDYSTLHYRPDDELRYEVGRKTVTGNTDRFTFLFRKP